MMYSLNQIRNRFSTALLAGTLLLAPHAWSESAPDPVGNQTGGVADVRDARGTSFVVTPPAPLTAADQADPAKVKAYESARAASETFQRQAAAEPLAMKLADAVGHNRVAINFAWVLLCAFLVMFMQAGFAMVETGLCRAKNASHTMAMNFLIYPLATLGFYLCGFALMFGGVGELGKMGGYPGLNSEFTIHLFGKPFGLFGTKGFLLQGAGYDTAAYLLFMFQMVFMDTTATIPTGALAERWKFLAFMIYGCAVGTIIYPFFGNWVWGGGWLAQLGLNFGLGHGHVDFAGSSVVHLQGGIIALVGAWLLGPRYGKFNKDGTINPIIPHNVPMVTIGTFILAFGWFGFNAGSSLAATDLRIAVVAVNTMLASATGAVAATLWMIWSRQSKPDPSMMCNGMLAGLVAITAPCAFVSAGGAAIIGIVAGVLVVEVVFLLEQRTRIDDPVGAIAVHGACGAWGCLALGLFADGSYGEGWNGVAGTVRGLFYGGGFSQLAAQLVGVTTCCVTVATLAYFVFQFIDQIVGNRVEEQAEIDGLDTPEVGIYGYHGYVMDTNSETPHPRGSFGASRRRRGE